MDLKLEIVTPTGKVLDARVSQVVAPGAAGEFAVLPNHRPGIVLLGGGTVRFEGPESGTVFVRGGVAEIGADRVLILAEEAVRPEQANRADAQHILERLTPDPLAFEFISDERQQQIETERRFAESVLGASR